MLAVGGATVLYALVGTCVFAAGGVVEGTKAAKNLAANLLAVKEGTYQQTDGTVVRIVRNDGEFLATTDNGTRKYETPSDYTIDQRINCTSYKYFVPFWARNRLGKLHADRLSKEARTSKKGAAATRCPQVG